MRRSGGIFDLDGGWSTLSDEQPRDDARQADPRQTGHRREFEPRSQRRQSFAERKELALADVAVFRTVSVRAPCATWPRLVSAATRSPPGRRSTPWFAPAGCGSTPPKARRAANSKSSPSPAREPNAARSSPPNTGSPNRPPGPAWSNGPRSATTWRSTGPPRPRKPSWRREAASSSASASTPR